MDEIKFGTDGWRGVIADDYTFANVRRVAGAIAKGSPAKIEEVDFKPPYIDAISRFVDLDKIAKANFKFAIDCMYGAGRNVLAGIFKQRAIEHIQIRSEINPLFPGINPEPIEPHVRMLKETV